MTHTKGKWKVEHNSDDDLWVSDENDVTVVEQFGEDNKLANARLIALAPELLEACKDMLIAYNMKVYRLDPKDLDLIDQLSNAIQQAEGGEND